MKIVAIDNVSIDTSRFNIIQKSRDLKVTLECPHCKATETKVVFDGQWIFEHRKTCPCTDKDTYLQWWAYELRCKACGAFDSRELDTTLTPCTCEIIKEREILCYRASAVFAYKFEGWACERNQLSRYDSKKYVTYCIDFDAMGIIRNNKLEGKFILRVYDRTGKEVVSYNSAEVNVDSPYDEYLTAVLALSRQAELFERGIEI